jgi:hypothetical protein
MNWISADSSLCAKLSPVHEFLAISSVVVKTYRHDIFRNYLAESEAVANAHVECPCFCVKESGYHVSTAARVPVGTQFWRVNLIAAKVLI